MALSLCSKYRQCGCQSLESGLMNSLSQLYSSSTVGNREWKYEKVPSSCIGIFRSEFLNRMQWSSIVGSSQWILGASLTITPLDLMIKGGIRLCSMVGICKAFLTINTYMVFVYEQSYDIAPSTIGTSAAIPSSVDNVCKLQVLPVF